MKKIFSLALMLLTIGLTIGLMSSTVDAEVRSFEGLGEHYLGEDETLNYARDQAKRRAERNALEQIYIYVSSRSEMIDFELAEDEIISITAGVMNVTDVKYRLTPDDETFKVEARLTADIDIDRVIELAEREVRARGLTPEE